MLLTFSNGEPFAKGATPYSTQAPASRDESSRIVLEVIIEGIRTTAMVDTGAPYLICSPELSRELALNPDYAIKNCVLPIRGEKINGHLHRLNIELLADEGEGLSLEATAFIPSREAEHPSFLGFPMCLDRIRFAVDPSTDTFYFGSQ